MKVIQLIAENIKKLVAVDITPTENLVQVTGRNGAGKSSVLDSLWWALAGAKTLQSAPIRTGANDARIVLHLKGSKRELVVTRRFARKEDGGFTTSIAVENTDGSRFGSPQTILDDLLGELSFDPLAFARSIPREQYEQLKRFVPGFDFDAIANLQRGDYDRRTDVNRKARETRARGQAIDVPLDTPEKPLDEEAAIGELETAGKHNAEIAQRKANRERLAEQAAKLASESDELLARASALEEQVRDLREQAASKLNDARGMGHRLAAAEALPEPIDTTEIRQRIERTRAVNANVRKLDQRLALVREAQALEEQSVAITAKMEQREAEKQQAIARAKMPVPGIAFGDGIVLLNGQPFDQASDAEQLNASVDIAIALNPTLRVIRIRDGSLLDEAAMRLLAQKADANDMQIWIERVDSSGKVGFVLEDGHLKVQQDEPTEATAAA